MELSVIVQPICVHSCIQARGILGSESSSVFSANEISVSVVTSHLFNMRRIDINDKLRDLYT